MGANASTLLVERNGPRPKLEDIPESCIALILSYLDPPEIAKLARLSRAFRAASSADFIWVPKLPSTYPYILSKLSDQGGVGDNGKKDVYGRLCRSSPFDGGTKEGLFGDFVKGADDNGN
ncbi:UNVERIFIED_CONTAM: F-box protein PP2-A13 [Sesamum angustifolium]|uniref:F-box protein PP2-A13 n=1 Tax=Sesamum angustifolium TaxID=2727405 RepID=A0AAW2N619_9LAMI